jgi:hypothetical protein
MSFYLYMRPIVNERTQIGDANTKHILCKAFAGNDGTVRADFELSSIHIPILQMLQRVLDNETHYEFRNDVDLIIAAINQYGAVEMFTDE